MLGKPGPTGGFPTDQHRSGKVRNGSSTVEKVSFEQGSSLLYKDKDKDKYYKDKYKDKYKYKCEYLYQQSPLAWCIWQTYTKSRLTDSFNARLDFNSILT